MLRRFALAALLVACVLQLSSASAPAAESILKLVPDSALGFVVVNGAAQLDAKLQAIARHFPGQMPGPLFTLKLKAGIQEGLDEKGTIAVVVLPPSGSDPMPTPLILVRVTDFDKFTEQLSPEKADGDVRKVKLFDSPCLIRKIGEYAAVTDGNNREVLEKVAVASDVPAAFAPWRTWADEQDVAGVVMQPGIKMISAQVQTQLAAVKDTMAMMGEQGEQIVAVLDLYAKLFQAAEEEVAAVGLALKVDKESAVHLTKRAMLVPEGSWAKLVAELKAAKENPLTGLPDEPFVLAGGVAVSDNAWQSLMSAAFRMMKSMRQVYNLTEEQADRLAKISPMPMSGIKSMSMILGVGRSGDPLYAGAVGLLNVEDDAKYAAAYDKYLKEYSEALKGVEDSLLVAPEVEKVEISGAAGLQMTMKMPKPKADDVAAGQQAKMFEAMFGPGGKLTTWLVPADKQHIVLGFVTKERLERTMESIQRKKPGLAGNDEVKKTAALLPSDALAILYVSPRGAIEFVKQMATAFGPAGAAPPMPEFAKTPPAGIAVTARSNEVQACVVFPAEVVQGIGAFAKKVAALQGGDGGTLEPADWGSE